MGSKKTLLALGFFLIFGVMSLLIGSEATPPSPVIKITPELKEKFPLKPHHEKLSFKCVDCHAEQGDDPENFKAIDDKGCLSCHKTKQYLADRLKFIDALHVNTHNSIHDGRKLSCDECHF